MKIGAVTMAYNDETVIKPTLRCLKPFVDTHVVILATDTFNGVVAPPDSTEQICLAEGVDIIKGFWGEEAKHRNVGVSALSDCDWVIHFDSDESMTAEDLEKFITLLGHIKGDAVGHRCKCYWSNPDFRLDPYPTHTTIIATRPKTKYVVKRNLACPILPISKEICGIEMHHLAWCSPKDILKKVTTYCHANEFNGYKWYTDEYINWEVGKKAIDPHGGVWDVVYDPLPDELRRMLD